MPGGDETHGRLLEQPSPAPGSKLEILIPKVGGLKFSPLSARYRDQVARLASGASVPRAGYQFLSPNGVEHRSARVDGVIVARWRPRVRCGSTAGAGWVRQLGVAGVLPEERHQIRIVERLAAVLRDGGMAVGRAFAGAAPALVLIGNPYSRHAMATSEVGVGATHGDSVESARGVHRELLMLTERFPLVPYPYPHPVVDMDRRTAPPEWRPAATGTRSLAMPTVLAVCSVMTSVSCQLKKNVNQERGVLRTDLPLPGNPGYRRPGYSRRWPPLRERHGLRQQIMGPNGAVRGAR